MLTNLFVTLCSWSPGTRRTLWQTWYNFLGSRFQHQDWNFMNYGYAPIEQDEPRTDLTPSEEPERYCIQMYEHLASAVPLGGKIVVEVGSGRGGGCSWVHRRHAPRLTRGLDFSSEAVALARRRHRRRGLSFMQGDAERIPIGRHRIDAVLNVESSHCYGSREAFLGEVHRILKPGGHFLYTDFFDSEELVQVRARFATLGFTPLREREITPNVLKALEQDHDRKKQKIKQSMPALLTGAFEQFAGVKDSQIFNAFRERKLTYWSWVLQKS